MSVRFWPVFCLSLVGLKFPSSGHCLWVGVATTTHQQIATIPSLVLFIPLVFLGALKGYSTLREGIRVHLKGTRRAGIEKKVL
jgi:hypothetical protein